MHCATMLGMFVIIHPTTAYPDPLGQRSKVYRCETASWDRGLVHMTEAVPELANPHEPIPELLYAPGPGDLIEIRPDR